MTESKYGKHIVTELKTRGSTQDTLPGMLNGRLGYYGWTIRW